MTLDGTKALLAEAERAATRAEAARLAGDAVLMELADVLEKSGLSKAEETVGAIAKVGLGALLAESLAEGRMRYAKVGAEIERLRRALIDRALSANEIKLGILALDDVAQRLSLVGGKGGGFDYPATQNRARDSLITFARSLHR